MRTLLFLLGLLMLGAVRPAPVGAQVRLTANTLDVAEGAAPAEATIDDVAWIAGNWVGEALGGTSEELWSAPAAGTMMGVYRLIRNGEVVFYEILTIGEEEGSLVLRLKHFDRRLHGWEERDETVDFRLVAVEEDAAYFRGMTFRRQGDDELEIYLALDGDDGSVREERFTYRRVGG